jgi:hypothetical protein
VFENTINAFTIIGYLFCLFILFCLCCLVCFLVIVAWEWLPKHRKNRYAKHQSSGEIVKEAPVETVQFFDQLAQAEARAKHQDDLEKLRTALKAPPIAQMWEHQDKRYPLNPEAPTEIHPFNMQGVEVTDATHPYFKDR